jgi:hypothetical protein
MLIKRVYPLSLAISAFVLFFSQLAYGDGVFVVVPGLEAQTTPGLITITNTTHQPISISWLAVKFSLPATSAPVREVDGTPALDWENTHPDSVTTSEYVFQNRVPFPGGKVAPGQKITLEFFKQPEPGEVAERLEIFGLSKIYEEDTPLEVPVSFYGLPFDLFSM